MSDRNKVRHPKPPVNRQRVSQTQERAIRGERIPELARAMGRESLFDAVKAAVGMGFDLRGGK